MHGRESSQMQQSFSSNEAPSSLLCIRERGDYRCDPTNVCTGIVWLRGVAHHDPTCLFFRIRSVCSCGLPRRRKAIQIAAFPFGGRIATDRSAGATFPDGPYLEVWRHGTIIGVEPAARLAPALRRGLLRSVTTRASSCAAGTRLRPVTTAPPAAAPARPARGEAALLEYPRRRVTWSVRCAPGPRVATAVIRPVGTPLRP